MKLFGSVTSPFVRKIRVILAEKALAHDFVIEDVWNAASTIATRNPLSKVPTLELTEGNAIYDSKVISEALELLHPMPCLVPSDIHHRIEIRKLEALGDGISEAAVTAFLETKFHGEDKKSDEWLKRQELKVDRGCEALAELLKNSKSGFLHNGFSLADISAGCALLYVELRMPQHPWRARHPELNAYADLLAQRESFHSTRANA
ncbi:MAG: glutathione S-transferase N-terminal domain-containing protein [Burkholderiales bacterium]|nr:glutathione S-transferase N-terminal domain-containing protein [Burkholderiales bacterium]